LTIQRVWFKKSGSKQSKANKDAKKRKEKETKYPHNQINRNLKTTSRKYRKTSAKKEFFHLFFANLQKIGYAVSRSACYNLKCSLRG